MLTVYKNSKRSLRFHNNDVRLEGVCTMPIKKPHTIEGIDVNDIIGNVYEDNTVFMIYNDGNFVLYYEDEDGNIIDNIEPLVVMLDSITENPDNEESFNGDFGDNFQI